MGELSTRGLQSLKSSFSEINSSSSSNHSNNQQQRSLLLENFMSLSNDDINPPEILAFSNHNHNHHHQQQQQQEKLPMNFADVNNNNNNNVQSFFDISPPALVPTTSSEKMIKSYGGRKRNRKDEQKHMERPKEVIHVRAKRGQATDSHSLAERVRREKINEKLRCLQDLVPGCYKTMGMAVMLDVIINYVQSLQNQIEFLSMKLSAASMYHDFNMEMDNFETMQGTNAYQVQEMERMAREGCGGPSNYVHPTWPL